MRYLIESELDTSEILDSLSEDIKNSKLWKRIPNQKGLYISEVQVTPGLKLNLDFLRSRIKTQLNITDLELVLLERKQIHSLTFSRNGLILLGPEVNIGLIGNREITTIQSRNKKSVVLLQTKEKQVVKFRNESNHSITLHYFGK